jgi:hypothetical protein
MSDSASNRPIFTLLRAGLGGCNDKPLVDTIGNTKFGAVRMTRYVPMTPKQLKLRRCELPGEVASPRKATPHRSPTANANSRGPALIHYRRDHRSTCMNHG